MEAGFVKLCHDLGGKALKAATYSLIRDGANLFGRRPAISAEPSRPGGELDLEGIDLSHVRGDG
jgi:hypothetical protein